MIEIEYKCLGPANKSILEGYKVKNATETEMIVHLNFSDPLYVSSFDGGKDSIEIRIVDHLHFLAKSDRTSIAQNYTLKNIKVPSQVLSDEDLQIMQQIASSASKSMIFTLVIPFCFMIFMSISIERVWSLYNTLQLMAIISKNPELKIPANAQFFIEVVEEISNFKIGENKNVQKWLHKYVFRHAQNL